MTTIRKVLIPTYGEPSVLQLTTSTLPPPLPQHIQVTVLYAGFSGADIAMRRGLYPMQKPAPLTPGYSLIGRVTTLGPSCTSGLKQGDLVASLTVTDAQAERVNLAEKYLILIPSSSSFSSQVDLVQATALVLDWSTAWGMIKHTAKVQPGQKVFIHGISGAVGYALLNLCLLVGAGEVYGTASERNHATIRAAGGTPFVYADKNWIGAMQKIGGVHAVFDPLGFESFDESYAILDGAEGGVVVGYGGNGQILDDGAGGGLRSPYLGMGKLLLRNLNVFSRKRTRFYAISKESAEFVEGLKELVGFLAEGRIEVVVKRVFELEEVQEAHRVWGKGTGVGSLVVRVSQ